MCKLLWTGVPKSFSSQLNCFHSEVCMNANHYNYQDYSTGLFLKKRQNYVIKFKTSFQSHISFTSGLFVNKYCMALLLVSLKYPLLKKTISCTVNDKVFCTQIIDVNWVLLFSHREHKYPLWINSILIVNVLLILKSKDFLIIEFSSGVTLITWDVIVSIQ